MATTPERFDYYYRDEELAEWVPRVQQMAEQAREGGGAQPGRPGTRVPVEVEVQTLSELDEALDAGAERVLLDNMRLDDIRIAVDRARGRAALEASGGITLENVRAVADTGVDHISVGALTHSAPALDLSLLIL